MAHRHKRRKTDDVDAASPTMINLQRSFDPNLADEAFAQAGAGTDPSGPPQWLRGILRSQQGRRLLAALASQHPECRLLSFATAASAPSAAAGSAAAAGGLETEDLESFLKRFGDCVTDVLDMVKKSQRAPSPGDEGANDALCKLCELCSATDFTLVYGLHLLRVADARGSKQTDQVATSARRLAQDVYHWASTGGMSSRVVHSALSANRSETASPGQHLLLCGRGMLQEREHGVAGLLASMEASGVASVGEAERLFASLKRQVNTEDRWSSATQLLQSLRSRAFLGAMLTALFNPTQHLERSQIKVLVDLISATVTAAASSEEHSEECETNAVARSLRSAADACHGVQRAATGWSVNRVCATATGDVTSRDNSIAGSSTAAQPVWLDVPVVAAGLLIWARTHQEVVLQSIDRENVFDIQAFVHLARHAAVRQPGLVNESVGLLCGIFRLREKALESLEVVGRASVKDATGVDVKRNCIEVLLDLLLLGGATTMPCLGAVHRFALGQQIDQSLLRHFTSQVAAHVNSASSCSDTFVRGYLDLLRCPQTIAALRGEHAQTEKLIIQKWLDTVPAYFGGITLD